MAVPIVYMVILRWTGGLSSAPQLELWAQKRSANAQPAAKVPRIGVLFPGNPANAMQSVEAFAKDGARTGMWKGRTSSWSAGSETSR